MSTDDEVVGLPDDRPGPDHRPGHRRPDHRPDPEPPDGSKYRFSRRALLGGSAAVAAGVAGYRLFEPSSSTTKQLTVGGPTGVGFGGRGPTVMAMHLHASFSQGKASYCKHFSQAVANNIDVIWFTEHDWRMNAKDYRTTVHFDSLGGENEEGSPWSWIEQPEKNVAGHKALIVSSPVSPRDPSPTPGALSVSAISADGLEASNKVVATTVQSRDNFRGTIAGQTITIEVFPTSVGLNAWMEMRLQLSDWPRLGPRPAGTYVLSYRFTTVSAPRAANSLLGIIPVAVKANQWNTVTINPEADVAALWPDLVAQDNSIFQLWLGATSSAQGTPAEGVFDFLQFHRSGVDGDRPLALQAQLIADYRRQFPAVTAYGGLEMSFYEDHLSQFGGQIHLPAYRDPDAAVVQPVDTTAHSHTQALADQIRQNGGFGSFNHPLGLAGPGTRKLTQVEQDRLRRETTRRLLDVKLYGLDMVEVGYQDRGGALFDAHFQLACALWRNSVFVTANGTSDDHNASGYASIVNRFTTGVFPPSRSQDDLLAELRAGRAFVSLLHDGPALMDLRLDDNPMGSVSVRPGSQRTLRFRMSAIPSRGSIEIIRGTVDDAGSHTPDPELRILTTASTPARGGDLQLPVDAGSACYFLARVRDADGHTVGFTNPCWSLPAPPPGGVPAARRAPDTLA
ncbi:MAG: hypothetical protein M3N98_01505 [Actinomycetota bacterium]|nr:hypothetical protein [Actinomycetota bacterium]